MIIFCFFGTMVNKRLLRFFVRTRKYFAKNLGFIALGFISLSLMTSPILAEEQYWAASPRNTEREAMESSHAMSSMGSQKPKNVYLLSLTTNKAPLDEAESKPHYKKAHILKHQGLRRQHHRRFISKHMRHIRSRQQVRGGDLKTINPKQSPYASQKDHFSSRSEIVPPASSDIARPVSQPNLAPNGTAFHGSSGGVRLYSLHKDADSEFNSSPSRGTSSSDLPQ